MAELQIQQATDFKQTLFSESSSGRDKLQAAGSLATLGAGSAVADVSVVASQCLVGVVAGLTGQDDDMLLHACLRDLAIDFPESHEAVSWWLMVRVIARVARKKVHGLGTVLGWLHQVCPRVENSSEVLRPRIAKTVGLQTKRVSTGGLAISIGGIRIWIAVLDSVLRNHIAVLPSLLES